MESDSIKVENINPRSKKNRWETQNLRLGLQKSHLEAIANELPKGPKTFVNFYSEDEFTNSDISIRIEDIGRLTFPLQDVTKAKFLSICNNMYSGKGEEISHYEIPAESVMVVLNKDKFAQVLQKIRFEMGFADSCSLEAQQGNLISIHQRGQFVDFHQDPITATDMVGTLVIVLPFFHVGGDLIVQYGTGKHAFCSSNAAPEIFKCIGFHADCTYAVEKVSEGFRVALKYKLILKSAGPWSAHVNPNLILKIHEFLENFKNEGIGNRFVCMLLHSYSEQGLKWHMLRGEDHVRSNALLAVAKYLDLIPYLALVKFKGVRKHANRYNCVNDSDELSLVKLVNLKNEKQGGAICTNPPKICWTQEVLTSFEHSELRKEGFAVKKYCAAVIMWPSSMKFELQLQLNYEEFVEELKTAMKSPGKENEVCEIVKKYGNYIYGKRRYNLKSFLFLTEIALYVNDGELALRMFSNFRWEILNSDIQKCLASLDRHFGADWCNKLLDKWKNPHFGKKNIINNVHKFVKQYLSFGGSNLVLEAILNEQLSKILSRDLPSNRNQKNRSCELFFHFLISCISIKNSELIDKTMHYINSNRYIFNQKVLIDLYSRAKNMISKGDLVYLEPLKLMKENYQLVY